LDDGFNQTMLMMMKRATPSEQPVGWFYTNADLSSHCLPYHDYYNRLISESSAKKEPPPVILLTVDTTFSSVDESYRMPVRAYISESSAKKEPPPVILLTVDTTFSSVDESYRMPVRAYISRDPHCAVFNPLRVEFDAFPGEGVALNLVQGGTAPTNKQREVALEIQGGTAPTNKQREVALESGLEQLRKSTGEILIWLERLLEYVNEVLAKPELPVDSTLGRRMMDIVNTAAAHMSEEKLDFIVKNSLRVLAKPELPVDSTLGRRMMDIVNTAAAHMSEEKLDFIVKNSLRVSLFPQNY
uniref:MPN domain-containing protein n=1 Tax=Gongylonema pulchrum TaxID=637853 RepID=A0A183E4C2_9BILA